MPYLSKYAKNCYINWKDIKAETRLCCQKRLQQQQKHTWKLTCNKIKQGQILRLKAGIEKVLFKYVQSILPNPQNWLLQTSRTREAKRYCYYFSHFLHCLNSMCVNIYYFKNKLLLKLDFFNLTQISESPYSSKSIYYVLLLHSNIKKSDDNRCLWQLRLKLQLSDIKS